MKPFFTLMLFALSLCVGSSSFAQYTFIGSGNWSDPSNWAFPGIPPNPGSVFGIYIHGTGPAILDIDFTIEYSSPFGSSLGIDSSSSLVIKPGKHLIVNTTNFDNYGSLVNYGTIEVRQTNLTNFYSCINNGTINLTGSGNLGNPTESVASIVNNGTINMDTLSSFYNNATSTFTNNGTVNNSSIWGFDSPGTLDNYGTLNNSGVFYNGEPGPFEMTAILNNYAVINNNANGIFHSLGTLNNFATIKNNLGAGMYIQNASPGSVVNNSNVGVITNDGTWVNELNSDITNNGTITNNNALTNSGTMVNNLTLINNSTGDFESSTYSSSSLENNGSFENYGTYASGIYKGSGGAYSGSIFTNAWILAPGRTSGCLSFGNDLINSNRMEMDINGTMPCTGFDQLQVAGTATADGQLALSFGTTPTVGQTFKIINAGSYAGTFASIVTTPPHTVSYSNGVITVNSVFIPAIAISNQSMKEGNSGTQNMDFTVSLNGVSADTVRMNFKTIDLTATAPSDYLSANGNVIFNPGETVKTVSITINGDNIVEGNEKFKVKLSAPQNATFAKSTGKGTIRNDDVAAISIQSDNLTIKPGVFVTVKVYPNPSSGAFIVSIPSFSGADYSLKVVDVKGRIIEAKKITSKDFSFGSNLKPGIYFIEIRKDNVLVAKEKIIRLN
ncbi:MAG: Calx-beta domain-containing protein [Panacibacter sp.]